MNPRIFKVKNAFLTTLIFLIATTVKASLADNIITSENLATLQSVNEVQVSPSGQFTAFTRSVPRKIYHEQDGKNWLELHVVDDKGEERPFISGKVNIKNIQWSADSRLLYFLSKWTTTNTIRSTK
jgi:dipeptidyl aminopeptidase/acylaminoacyl peptidase